MNTFLRILFQILFDTYFLCLFNSESTTFKLNIRRNYLFVNFLKKRKKEKIFAFA